MAVSDDVSRLAAQEVVYLARSLGGGGVTEVFRGRLRQALNGNWVFNAFTGQNGVVGFDLGQIYPQNWTSSDSPGSGIQISIANPVYGAPNVGTLVEYTRLTNVIPADFTD